MDKELLRLLIIVYNHIRCRTPRESGFCAFVSGKLIVISKSTDFAKSIKEETVLSDFFKNQSANTDFVSKEDMLSVGLCGYDVYRSKWLFKPYDWKARRKWLKELIEKEKQNEKTN